MFAAEVVVVLAAIAAVQSHPRDVFDETPNCMPPMEGIPTMLNCFADVTGTAFNHDTMKQSDITKENKIELLMCISKVFGMVSSDEKTFDLEMSEMAIELHDTTEEIKKAWKKDVNDCAAKGGDGRAFIVCSHEAFMKNCA